MPSSDAEKSAAATKRGVATNIIGIAIIFGTVSALHLPVWHALLSLGIQWLVFFGHALPWQSEKFYDLSGSVTHFALVILSVTMETQVRTGRQLFVTLCSAVWMTRLGTFLYLRVLRDGRDARFDPIKPYPVRFLSFWTIQALWVLLIQLPVLLLNNIDDAKAWGNSGCALLEKAFMVLWVLGFVFEYVADTEKMSFRNKPENRHKFITGSVWSLCRHPNYFGEILMWASMAGIATVAAMDHNSWRLLAAWGSPAFTAFLLFKVTGIPLIARAGMRKWGTDRSYLHYIKNTSLIIPWFPASPLSSSSSSFSQSNKKR